MHAVNKIREMLINEFMASGITLTNNETKDIIKVIRSLENRRILLKETTRKISCRRGRFLNFLGTLMSIGLPLVKNVLISLDKSVLIPLRLISAALATDVAIQKKGFRSSKTALIISNKDMKDIMNIVKYLEKSDLLIKVITETIKNVAKEQTGRFLSLLLCILAATLLGNMLSEKPKIPG